MNNKLLVGAVIVAVLLGAGWLAYSSMEEEKAMMDSNSSAMDKGGSLPEADGETAAGDSARNGSYEAYAPEKLVLAASGKVVLFFRASWCPTCRALDASIRSGLAGIPSGVTILDVNYDDSTALKQKYGVTYQHTLVQVDAEGNQLAKWSNSPNLADIISRIK